jgi:hypothetical protein
MIFSPVFVGVVLGGTLIIPQKRRKISCYFVRKALCRLAFLTFAIGYKIFIIRRNIKY